MTHNLEIARMLTVSTGHIKTIDILNDLEATEATMISDDGIILYIGDCTWKKFTPELEQFVKLCRENDCDYLRFDCDGPEVKGITIYTW